MSVAALMALYSGCASSDVSTNRQGGGALPVVPEASVLVEASLSDVPVPWCAAYHIINCVCQQCHQNPPLNGAPIPLMTYADTQAPFPFATSKGLVWQTMQTVVATRFMPYLGDKTVMPPVLPLSDDDYDTLLSWLAQGAVDLGGQDCPMECDWSKGPPPGR
ncbi:MAG TPA: hypothetical protein VK745_19010 [Polyangiaceae bacterium]|jgi:hypothetical protein|nr:hypothetical protein [Polyangiaceae bacterium]